MKIRPTILIIQIWEHFRVLALAKQTAGQAEKIIQRVCVWFLLHFSKNMLDLLLECIPENKRVLSKICLKYYFHPFHGI